MERIVLSYRTNDSPSPVERLVAQLAGHFGLDDILTIHEESMLDEGLKSQIAGAQVFLPVFGPNWIDAHSPPGQYAVASPGDPVRQQLETAMALKKPIVPVVVGGGELPLLDDLPDSLHPLMLHREIHIRMHPYEVLDIRRLLQRLEGLLVTTMQSADSGKELPDATGYQVLAARGERGLPEDVDYLMEMLVNGDAAVSKLVDYSLGLVRGKDGVERLRHYLFHGKTMQRNYAALYFKRREDTIILEEAVRLGAIDWEQGFSR